MKLISNQHVAMSSAFLEISHQKMTIYKSKSIDGYLHFFSGKINMQRNFCLRWQLYIIFTY